MKKPELNPNALKIDKLISRIDNGEIKIPAFQRGYVWKQNQIIELLESIVKQYPIGSLLLWEAGEKEKLKSTRNIAGYKIPDRGENWPVNYVLDGQQRLTSIYAVFSGEIEQDGVNEKYNPDPDIFEIYYDFSSEKFIPKSEAAIDSETQVSLRGIIDPIKLIDELGKLSKEYHQEAKLLSSIFLNYEVPVIQIKNRTKEDVGMIFERINNTGTKLNTLDLMTAWTWAEDFHLLDAIDALTDELEEKSFGSIDPKIMLQVVSGVIIGSTKTENVLRLTGERVREHWDNVVQSTKAAVDFLATQVNCSNIEFLPYHQQLIPLARYFSRTKRSTNEQIKTLVNFFWRTSFSDRYSTGQTTAKMDADIEFVDDIIDYKFESLEKYQMTLTEAELVNTTFSKSNPTTRAVLLLMAQCEPLDLVNGARIDLGRSLSSFNRKQYHHIFPNDFLKKMDVDRSGRFTVVNFCFLPADSNRKISNKSPSDYFFNLVPADLFTEICSSNLMPTEREIYAQDNYKDFLSKRATLIKIKAIELAEEL
ncbi:TPA: GmrSD restriction endonuclease domain-containing protein [Pseudomonas aeruginosa]|uniref:GmrSD restriction endonuclease domain-containing protein n=1 Tax=Pseudomonas aeruginosa TaxID=287 RepID=UPI000F536181|nr:DUF262 domain-containing protein [Pseudomonas aeruginosa]RPR22399.1 hypothetical protein IPC1060_07015 [Pseudomonas aeruginosa]